MPEVTPLSTKYTPYTPSVERVFRNVCPGNNVNVVVVKAIAYIANELSVRVIEQARAEAGDEMLEPLHIKRAVELVMTEALSTKANAEAVRYLDMLSNYERKDTVRTDPNLVSKRMAEVTPQPIYVYRPSVERVFRNVCPDNSVNVGVVKAIAYIANELSVRVIEKARAEAGDETLEPLHIKRAVESLIPETLSTKTNAEAVRYLDTLSNWYLRKEDKRDPA